MYDGINSDAAYIRQHFPNAELVAGYADGKYKWSQADWDLFPNAVHVWICALPASTGFGDVIDCENGDATPAQAGAWVQARKKEGLYRPTVYCSKSNIAAVRQATGKLVLGKDWDLWVADPTGQAHAYASSGTGMVTAQAAAVQYAWAASYDMSAVWDAGWPHRKPPNAPQPAPPVPAPAKISLAAAKSAAETVLKYLDQ